ncbi:MAG: hypothetical protein WBA93_36770 [Microcoleaceae cyanobacterium]
MPPETVITVGMMLTFTGVVLGTWKISKYIGRIENKVDNNRDDIDGIGTSVRRKDKNIVRHINNHCVYLGRIESFLEEEFDYRPNTKMYINEDEL